MRASHIWFKIAVALIGLGTIVRVSHLFAQLGAVMLGIGIVMILSAAMWWWLRLCGRAGAEIGSELRVASMPVPSPAEIAFQVQAEWGRPATLQEVAAVHQMLTSRRNQALVNSGIALGALYLLERNGH